jgi:predicted O-methyltransferase YrrM
MSNGVDLMSNPLWTSVDEYISQTLIGNDPSLTNAQQKSHEAGLPPYQVSPAQGKYLFLLAKAVGAQRILELGTLGGYSTIWLARAVGDAGRVVTLELNPQYAQIASENIANAGLSSVVQIRVGDALDSLAQLVASNEPPFDFVFIDADKIRLREYFSWALKLTRIGSMIIVDNVIREGAVIDQASSDPKVQGVRRLNEFLVNERRISATTIQTVGGKGYDGFTLALVTN